jgi:hypothetical protein
VWRMLLAKRTIFAELQLIRSGPLILSRCIITAFAFTACQRYDDSHRLTP